MPSGKLRPPEMRASAHLTNGPHVHRHLARAFSKSFARYWFAAFHSGVLTFIQTPQARFRQGFSAYNLKAISISCNHHGISLEVPMLFASSLSDHMANL
jgi:hypothetical protein